MAIFAIGDLHLSVAAKKPMDIFDGWDNHAEKLIENWNKHIRPGDTVVLVGDTSWGLTLAQSAPDFRLIHNLPGQKIVLKGNHDHWWGSMTKMNEMLAEHGFDSIKFLHNNSYCVEGLHICGSRGWIFENGQPHDQKLINREAIRVEASLKSRSKDPGETVLFLHYPPLFAAQRADAFIDLMRKYHVNRCYYGHIHGPAHRLAVQGRVGGIQYTMVAADYLSFDPLRIQ